MKTLVASSLALGLLPPAAWATSVPPSTTSSTTPVVLTEPQMDGIAAGAGGLEGRAVDTFAGSTTFKLSNTNDATKMRYYTPSFGG
jgi:hypothetical protein